MATRSYLSVDQGKALGLVMYLTGVTIQEAADAVGMSASHLSNILNGRDSLSSDNARRLSALLRLVPGRLLKLPISPKEDPHA